LVIGAFVAIPSYADTISLRGGIGLGAGSDYTYALDRNTSPNAQITTNFGVGGFGSITFADTAGFWGNPMEYGMSFGFLDGSDGTNRPTNSACSILTFLGTVSDCIDTANTENLTVWLDGAVMFSFGAEHGTAGTEFLAGAGGLIFSNNVDVDYLYPSGFSYFAEQNTRFAGLGVRVGARHRVGLNNGKALQLEGFLGGYRGRRTTNVAGGDLIGGVRSLRDAEINSEMANVAVLEFSPSLLSDASWAGDNAEFEIGLNIRHMIGVNDSRNYGDRLDILDLEGGKERDSVTAVSLFAGLNYQF